MLLVGLVGLLGGRFAIITRSSLSCNLVTLTGSQLTTVEIDLSILGDETNNLMICRRDEFHAVQPGTPQDNIERK